MTTVAHSRLTGPTEQRTPATTGRSAVPWSQVVTLAVVIAFADGFWVTSLRGAAGAIERTQSPFLDWLRESTLVLPVFVVAVLAAFTVALHRFGPRAHRPRAVLGTALLVVAAGTLAGVLGLVASSAYDYYLQSQQLVVMDSMRSMCGTTADCSQMQRATLLLQVRTVGYGSVILLLTNLVVVGWVVAVRGGRFTLARRARGAAGAVGSRASRLDDLRVFLAAGLVGTAVIHAAVVPERLGSSAPGGVLLVVLTAAELAVAIQLGARLRRSVLLAAVVVSAGPLLVWAYTRSLGLVDVAAGAVELATLAIAVVLLRDKGASRRPAVSAHASWLVLLAVLAVTFVGLGGSHLPWFDYTGGISGIAHHH